MARTTPAPTDTPRTVPDRTSTPEWNNVPLGLDNYHITAREGSTELDKWTFSNPTGASLRIKRDSSDRSEWLPGPADPLDPWDDYSQRAPVIIYKVQMNPRPLAAHALTGVTDNRWRHGECDFTVAMRLSQPSRPGGYGHGIGCGVGLLFCKTDFGTGAALVTSNPTPPFLGTQATPDIGYASVFLCKDNDTAVVDWNRQVKSRSGNSSRVSHYDIETTTGPFGASGALDTVVIKLPHYPHNSDGNKGMFTWWFEDSRVNRSVVNGYYPHGSPGSGFRFDGTTKIQSYQFDTEGTYVYIVIMPMMKDSGNADSIDSQVDVLELKYNLSHIKVGA